MAVPPKVIENARLVEKRKQDGAQCYRWNDNPMDVLWLCGWQRASNVKVGDKGRLTYTVGPGNRYGMHFFEKYK